MSNTFTQNFIPELWDESIERNLKPALVFADDCTKEFEGKISKLGDTVHILGIKPPTISEFVLSTSGSIKNDTNRNSAVGANLSSPEGIEGYEQALLVDTVDYFNFELNDIDRVQSMKGLMDTATAEAAHGLAKKVDTNLAALIAAGATVNSVSSVTLNRTYTGSATTTKVPVTTSTIMGFVDEAIQKLYENNVSPATEIIATVSPRFYTILKQAYVNIDKDNSEMLKNGRVGRYGNVIIKMSNNVVKSDFTASSNANDVDTISFRTRRAVAFAKQLDGTETLRSQNHFANIVRGKILYGAKIIRPAELVNLKVAY